MRQFCHYKVCSTFDSSPAIGNIGRAIEIGRGVFRPAARAAGRRRAAAQALHGFRPSLRGLSAARSIRIDRHPVMSRHPVTPMDESDLLLHLAKQTKAEVDLIDVYDAATQAAAGEALLQHPGFVVGSSGVEYALMSALKKSRSAAFAPVPAVKQTLVISGSVSPTTERQIKYASQHGFTPLAADALQLAKGETAILAKARVLMEQGESPLIYSASGPGSDQGERLKSIPNGREILSKTLGQIARQLVSDFKLKRLIIAGGDTSSHALGELDIHALTTRFPLTETPGSPLCTAHSSHPGFDGLEVAMKGGQVGGDDYFVKLKNGLSAA